LHGVLGGEVVGEGVHPRRAEIEAPADTGIDDQTRLLAGFAQGRDRRLYAATTLVLLLVERWHRLFGGTILSERYLREDELLEVEETELEGLVETWRERLTSVGWFMCCLNEQIARKANEEDQCTGHFWEGRIRYSVQVIIADAEGRKGVERKARLSGDGPALAKRRNAAGTSGRPPFSHLSPHERMDIHRMRRCRAQFGDCKLIPPRALRSLSLPPKHGVADHQVGIGRIVHVGLDHGGVVAPLQKRVLVDTDHLVGGSHDHPVDQLQGIGLEPREVLPESAHRVALEGAV